MSHNPGRSSDMPDDISSFSLARHDRVRLTGRQRPHARCRRCGHANASTTAVQRQAAPMRRNVPGTSNASASMPASGAPISALPRIPMLYVAITRPRRSSRARSCSILETVTLKRPQTRPSRKIPANAPNGPKGAASQVYAVPSSAVRPATNETDVLAREAIRRDPARAPNPRHDIRLP